MRYARHILLAIIVTTLAIWIGTYIRVVSFTTTGIACYGGAGGLHIYLDPIDVEWIGIEYPGLTLIDPDDRTAFPMPSADGDYVVIPCWAIVVSAFLPWLILHRRDRERRRRARIGACASCGYDLTGNESGVCSECGEVALLATGE